MREIKTFNHTEGLYLTTHYTMENEVQNVINEWKSQVYEDCIKNCAKHYVYCTKEYDKDNVLIEINLYATPLDDDEFYKRTKTTEQLAAIKGNTIQFGVWHKGTSY